MVRDKFTGSGRKKESGFLAVHKQDFNAHHTGGSFRHTADDIDLTTVIPNVSGSNVEEALQNLASSLFGVRFQIGEGYDNCTGNLADAFNDALASPALANGGTIIVKSGSYCMTSSVSIPPGIAILGESQGSTFINGEMSETPMFIFNTGTSKESIGSRNMEEFADSNLLANITLYDNKDGNAASGNASMSAVPMIQIRHGVNLSISKCTIIGRTNPVLSSLTVTHRAVGISGVTSAGVGTNLLIDRCYIDGIKVVVDYDVKQGSLDYLRLTNNKFYTYGDSTANSGWVVSTSNANVLCDGNKHIGSNTGGTGGFIQIKDFTVLNTNTAMVFVSNHGGMDGGSAKQFLTDLRSVKDPIKITMMNSWGLENEFGNSFAFVDFVKAYGVAEQNSGNTTDASGIVHHTFAHRFMNHNPSNNQTYFIDPAKSFYSDGTSGAGFGLLNIVVNQSVGTDVNILFDTVSGFVKQGTFCEIVIQNQNGANVVLSWDSAFKFATEEDKRPTNIAGAITRWKATLSNGVFLVDKKLDYGSLISDDDIIKGTSLFSKVEYNSNLQAIGKALIFSGGDELSRGFLVGATSSQLLVEVSADDGSTWDTVNGGFPTTGVPNVHYDIIHSKNKIGDVIIPWGDGGGVAAYSSLSGAVATNGSTSVSEFFQSVGDLEEDSTPPSGYEKMMRGTVDDAAGYYWLAGQTSAGRTSVAFMNTSSSFSGGGAWTQFQADGAPDADIATWISTGPLPSTNPNFSSTSDSVVVLANGGNRYYVLDYPAGTPSSFTRIEMGSILPGKDILVIIYNKFWNKYLIVPEQLDFTGLNVASVTPNNLGSGSVFNYSREFSSNVNGFTITNLTLNPTNPAVTIGKWCFFTSIKGGSLSGIIGTPDMGKSWYFLRFYGIKTGDHAYITSMLNFRGKLMVVASDESKNFSRIYETQVLEKPFALARS